MQNPILIIMAAGLGSRYGGLKQMEAMTPAGEIIMDFSLYDARRAGFRKVVFVVKEETEPDFRALIEPGAGRHFETVYARQRLDDLPPGYTVPEGRVKPWGTCHAVRCCRFAADAPFAVINADDYYGAEAFRLMYDHLKTASDGSKYDYAMVGYPLGNTLTDHGAVARGVCETDAGGTRLLGVTERTKVARRDGVVRFTEDGETWYDIPDGALASMNFWGFTTSLMDAFETGFPAFLDGPAKADPQKAEYLLPAATDALLKSGRAEVKILRTTDRWYGVTYREDKPFVTDALQALKAGGLYPERLWG